MLIVIIAALGPLVAPYSPIAQDAAHSQADPVWAATGSWAHPFGTDALGRDVLSRLIFGARTSLLIAFTAR